MIILGKQIEGYKALDGKNCNQYGQQFEEGKWYHRDGDISFGVHGNGYHFCQNFEDTFRYFPTIPIKGSIFEPYEEVHLAKVIGSGYIVESFDDYYGYYGLYSAQDLWVEHILTREEIIALARKLGRDSERLERFVSSFLLTEEEIELFKRKGRLISNAIQHYQRDLNLNYQKEHPKQKTIGVKKKKEEKNHD